MYKQVILVRNDLKMGKGKIAAQSAHACLEAYKKALIKNPHEVILWEQSGMEKVVLKVNSKEELLQYFEAMKKKIPTALIKDAGRTQINPGEPTCIASGPAKETELDKYTAKLKLL
jgi:peptidyl-tRNA hydrolase, PTH2 family